MNLVTTTYRDGAMVEGNAECWTVVLTMVQIIWWEIRKVRVKIDIEYGSDILSVMVGQYLWGNLQVHRVMDDLFQTKTFHHL